MKRRSILPKLNGRRRRAEVIPYNPVHKARCPFCRNLQTVYVPALAEGFCHACGKAWRFLADPEAGFDRPTIKPRRIDYRDLVGFMLVMHRQRIRNVDDAIGRYQKLGIVSPDRDTFERAWREAGDMA